MREAGSTQYDYRRKKRRSRSLAASMKANLLGAGDVEEQLFADKERKADLEASPGIYVQNGRWPAFGEANGTIALALRGIEVLQMASASLVAAQ